MIDLEGRRALVVDDEVLVQFAVSQMLEDAGVSVVLADTGAEALEMLGRTGRFDVLVTDITMPCLDGWTLAERVRAVKPDIAVVYVSGISFVPPRQVPGGLLVRKPFLQHELIQAVSRALHSTKKPVGATEWQRGHGLSAISFAGQAPGMRSTQRSASC